jgi:type VI secretion system secreted protein VgrG
VVIAAHFELRGNPHETGGLGEDGFHGSYTCVNSQVPYHPPCETPRPRVDGAQTALVVGPKGQEIWTDPLGRVKVQFFWDQEGTLDESSSCWVRVAQIWAGANWGAIHIPRINQEVIVDFLEGDPDRPIITGRVYNAVNTVPYTLPDNKTQSGIKSRSTLGGTPANFNEIRFEDLKGKEELYVQAERNHTVNVKNDRSVTVGGLETYEIMKTRLTTVHEKDTAKMLDEQETTVTGLVTEAFNKLTQGATNMTFQGTNVNVKAGGTVTIESPSQIQLKVGANHLTISPEKIELSGGGSIVTIHSGAVEVTGATIKANS